MPFIGKPRKRQLPVCRRLKFFGVLTVVFAVAVGVTSPQAASPAEYQHPITPQSISNPQGPVRAEVPRLSVLMGETRDIPLPAPMTSVLVVSPEIASVVLSARSLTLTGLNVGETILLAFDGQRRSTFVVEVIGRTYATTHRIAAIDSSVEAGGLSGSYSLTYSAPFSGAPTLIRQSFDFEKKLSNGRTLRLSGDVFKFMGAGNQGRARTTALGFGLNRLSLGIVGPEGSVDILDSQINVSPLSFNNYTMRGFHLVSTPTSRLRGIEVFAGLARPSLSLFEMNQGGVMGVVVPVAQGEFWRVRAGMFVVSPGRDSKSGSGGKLWHVDGHYTLAKDIEAEGELDYANGGLSWRARLDLKRGPITAYGEILRADRRSPLVTIGAQGGGRQTQEFGLQWLASKRLYVSLNYDHTHTVPPANALRAALDRTTLSANTSYQINRNSRIGFRYVQQQIEVGAPGGGSRFRLESRTATVSHDIRFNKGWTNYFQARVNSSREARADAGTDSGFNLNDQLRFSFKGGSATAFVNYANQKQSLAGLIVRNPQLLPPLLQPVFAADPVRFLQENRDILGLLLPGVELPQTRGVDIGLRFQKSLARVNVAGEVRYSAGEIFGRNQRNLLTSINLGFRLDAANSVQVSASRSFGSIPQSALTISYIHRFGAGSGGGMQFSRLLGLERGVIEGRVFFDRNGNGQQDANEPGVPEMKVQIDGDRSATTDANGRFHFQVNSGVYNIAVVSADLGLRWRASTATEQHGFLAARKTINVSFGITNCGSVAGRVFNDVSQAGEQAAGNLPGVGGVRVSLHSTTAGVVPLSVIVDNSGGYQFRSVPPGSYTLAIDPETLPPDFRVPAQSSWIVTVDALQNFYQDIPLSAERALSGVVFVDKDGDGKFDPEKDEPVEGARVITGSTEVITGKGGNYILRKLPSGRTEVRARASGGAESPVVSIELSDEPTRRKGVNLILSGRPR